jgi:hypothetical protein
MSRGLLLEKPASCGLFIGENFATRQSGSILHAYARAPTISPTPSRLRPATCPMALLAVSAGHSLDTVLRDFARLDPELYELLGASPLPAWRSGCNELSEPRRYCPDLRRRNSWRASPGPRSRSSPKNRSLSIKPRPNGDVLVHSHAGDDNVACLQHVRDKLQISKESRGEKRVQEVYTYRMRPARQFLRSCASSPRASTSAHRTAGQSDARSIDSRASRSYRQ